MIIVYIFILIIADIAYIYFNKWRQTEKQRNIYLIYNMYNILPNCKWLSWLQLLAV